MPIKNFFKKYFKMSLKTFSQIPNDGFVEGPAKEV